MEQQEDIGTYKPFKYPPDYALAKLHQKATIPGEPDPLQLGCPCCNEPIKRPYKKWWKRSIEQDFKNYGGAMVCYFWLLRLYIITILAVIFVYGIYLQYLINQYCSQLSDATDICSHSLSMWITTNEKLLELIENAGNTNEKNIFIGLRCFAFCVLIIVNTLSLFIVKRFKDKYPEKINVSHFALFFKNLKNDNVEQLLGKLRSQFGDFQIEEAFAMRQLQPFVSAYNSKLSTYFQLKNQKDQKRRAKLKSKLQKEVEMCEEHEAQTDKGVGRIIVVFKELEIRQKILAKYEINQLKRVTMLLKNENNKNDRFFCQEIPRPQQMIWKNIGIRDRNRLKLTVKVLLLYSLLFIISVCLLFGVSRVLYLHSLDAMVKQIITKIIFIFANVIIVGWKLVMVKLSDMRYPETLSARIIFIIISTSMLYFYYFLWLPTIYLFIFQEQDVQILDLMCNHCSTVIIFQFILVGLDVFYRVWKAQMKKVDNPSRPYGCQKMLHAYISYPAFPFAIKMIILFKIWSFITFFSFHTPAIIFLICFCFIFIYAKDKYNVYSHYRMETIDSKVPFKFLKFYTSFFSIYMYLVFLHTQTVLFQYIFAALLTAVAVVLQLFYFRDKKVKKQQGELDIKLISDMESGETSFYKDKYQKFISEIRSSSLDMDIKNYLSDGTMKQSSSDVLLAQNTQ